MLWLISCLLVWGGGLSAFSAPDDDFNPQNPPDPTAVDFCRLKVSADPAESAYVSGGGKYTLTGEQIYVSASARNTEDYTYTFKYWTLNGEKTSYSQDFWFSPQSGSFELVAHFEKAEVIFDPENPADPSASNIKRKYYLYLNSNIDEACSFNMDSGTKIKEGEEVYVSVNPNDGFEFEGWKMDGETVSTDTWYSFTMPSSNTTLQACFSEIPFDPENPKDPTSQNTDVDNSSRLIVKLGIGSSSGDVVDNTRVVINGTKTVNYDVGTDASKFISADAKYQIYSIDDADVKYSVNERPADGGDLALGIVVKEAGEVKISAIRLDCSATLTDKVTGIVYDLALNDVIFESEAGTFEDRFILKAPSVHKSVADFTVSDIAAVTYDGSEHTPAVTVKDGEKTLKVDSDYSVVYSNNVNAGTATITIVGKGEYAGTKEVTFTINPKSASNITISDITAVTYTGSEQTPAVTVKDGEKTLVLDTDYSVAYSNNVNAGTADVTVTGKGNYSGTKSVTFTINPKSASDFTVSDIAAVTYTGSEQTPAVTVKDGEQTLVLDTDYSVAYSNNVNAGTADVTVTGKGNYSGTKSVTFTINPKSASDFTVSDIAAVTYTGFEQTPAVTVKDGEKTLVLDTDYSVAYSNNVNAGTATVTVTGKGNYSGTKSVTFTINTKSASDFTVSDIAAVTYTGSEQTPAVTVKDGEKTLVLDTDYSVAYSNNVNAGTATVTVTGKGNYSNTKSLDFTIDKVKLTITAKSYTITQGDDLPELELEYEGFVNDENSSNLKTLPVVSTAATSSSLPGDYDITVSGAESVNYSISYVNGTMTITRRNGDANGDGKVDKDDVQSVGNYIMGMSDDNFVFESADVNRDGTVDASDLVIIINFLNGKIPALTR